MNLKIKLEWALKHGKNVLLEGEAGTGKTTVIKEVLEEAGLTWKYFSCSTLDPWTDLVGIPREGRDEKGQPCINFLLPKGINDVQVVFLDEFNRAPKKVRNACLELLQFKSLNGNPFPNLKVVWAAVNPFDENNETYDTEHLDPAQLDRFQIQVKVPYKPDKKYFTKKFGDGLAGAALSWWTEMPELEKKKVSPRRLDYALEIFQLGGELRDVLPESSNVAKLVGSITNGPIIDSIESFYRDANKVEASKLVAVENNFEPVLNYIQSRGELKDFYFPLFPREKISSMMQKGPYQKYFEGLLETVPVYAEVASEIIRAGVNMVAGNKLRARIAQIQKTNPNFKVPGLDDITVNKTLKTELKDMSESMADMSNKDAYKRYDTFKRLEKMTGTPETLEKMDGDDIAMALVTLEKFRTRSYAQTLKKYDADILAVLAKIEEQTIKLGNAKDKADFHNALNLSAPSLASVHTV